MSRLIHCTWSRSLQPLINHQVYPAKSGFCDSTQYMFIFTSIFDQINSSFPIGLVAVSSSQRAHACFKCGASPFSCTFAPSGPDGVS